MIGPTTSAIVNVLECSATTRGSAPGGATSGFSERSAGAAKARATPNANTMRKIGPTAVGSVVAYQASVGGAHRARLPTRHR